MWKTGHSLIKKKMAEINAPLAGEMSGHIFFRDKYYGFDDALYAAIRLIELLGKRKENLSTIRTNLPIMVNTPELRFQCDEELKFAAIDEAKALLTDYKNITVSDIDGVRVTTPHGWWLLRASNTQAVLVARCEAENDENLRIIKRQLKEILVKIGVKTPNF
jgi:phosphomannomutase